MPVMIYRSNISTEDPLRRRAEHNDKSLFETSQISQEYTNGSAENDSGSLTRYYYGERKHNGLCHDNSGHALNKRKIFGSHDNTEHDPKSNVHICNTDLDQKRSGYVIKQGFTSCATTQENYPDSHLEYANTVRDTRQGLIERNKKYLTKKKLEEIASPLPYDIYKHKEPRKGKICARSFSDLEKSGIKLLPYSTPKMDSTYEIMEHYKRKSRDLNARMDNGYSTSASKELVKQSHLSKVASMEQDEQSAFLKGMIDFKCHGIMGTLAKMAVVKGDLLDLLAVKLNASAMYNDTYYQVTHQGDKPISSKRVYFTDMYQPIKGGVTTQALEYGTNGSVRYSENVSSEEYHREMIGAHNHDASVHDDFNREMLGPNHNAPMHDSSNDYDGSLPVHDQYDQNSYSRSDTFEHNAPQNHHFTKSHWHSYALHKDASPNHHSNRSHQNSYMSSNGDDTNMDQCSFNTDNGSLLHNTSLGFDTSARTQYSQNDTSDKINKYENGSYTSQTAYDTNGYDKDNYKPHRNHWEKSFESNSDKPYSIKSNQSSNPQMKQTSAKGLKSWSYPGFGTTYGEDTLSEYQDNSNTLESPTVPYNGNHVGTNRAENGYQHEVIPMSYKYTGNKHKSGTYSEPRSSKTGYSRRQNKDGSQDIERLLNTSNSLLNYHPGSKSNALDDSYSFSQNNSVYDSCDDFLSQKNAKKPSYNQIMQKYDKSGSYILGSMTSSSTLSSLSKEDYRSPEHTDYVSPIHGLTENTATMYYPYQYESVERNQQQPSPIDVTRRFSVTSSEDMTSLGKAGGKKRECKPNFIIKPRRCFADEAGPGKFKASFDGEPRPTVEWLKKGVKISPDGKYKTSAQKEFHFLEIDNVDKADKGEYTCVLTNHLGTTKASAELEVYATRKKSDSLEPKTPTAKLSSTVKDTNSSPRPYTSTLSTHSLQNESETQPPKLNTATSSGVANKIFQDSAAKRGAKKETGVSPVQRNTASKSKINYEDLARKSAARRAHTDELGAKKSVRGSSENLSSVKSGYTSRLSSNSRLSPGRETGSKQSDSPVRQVSQTSLRLNDREKTPPSSRYGQVKSKIVSRRDTDNRPYSAESSVTSDEIIRKPETKISTIETKVISSEVKLDLQPHITSNDGDSSVTVEINVKKNEEPIPEITSNKSKYGISVLNSSKSSHDSPSSKLDKNANERKGISSVGVKSRTSKLGETAAKFERNNDQDSGIKSRSKYQSPISTRGISSYGGDSKISSVKSKFEDKSNKTNESKANGTPLRIRESKTYSVESTLESSKKFEEKPRKTNAIEGKGLTTGIFSEQKSRFESKTKDSDDSGKLKDVGASYDTKKYSQIKSDIQTKHVTPAPLESTKPKIDSPPIESKTPKDEENIYERTSSKDDSPPIFSKPPPVDNTFKRTTRKVDSPPFESKPPKAENTFETRKPRQSKLRSLSQKFAEFEENDSNEFSSNRTQSRKGSLLENQSSLSADTVKEENIPSPVPDNQEEIEDEAFEEATDISESISTEKDKSEEITPKLSESTESKTLSEPAKMTRSLSKESAVKSPTPQSSVRSRYQPKSSPEPTPSPASKRAGSGMSSTVSTALSKTENLTGRRGARNPPEVGVPLTDMEANDGQYVKLKCSFTGTPSPTISWYFNGAIQKDSTEIKQSFDGQWATLKFKDVFPDDTGRYEAVATNRFGEVKTACILTVKEAKPPKLAPAFTRPLQDKTVSDGDMLEFKCEYTGNPEPELTWFHEGKVLESSKDFLMTFEAGTAVLRIAEVFPEDSGLYELYARNEKGETKTVANLTVKETPEDQHVSQKVSKSGQEEKPAIIRGLKDMTVNDGQKITLQVEVSGSLPIEVCWVHGQEEIGPDHNIYQVVSDGHIHKLVIPDVLPEDEGKWMCEAYNNHGDIDTACVLTVRGSSEKSSDVSSTEIHAREEVDDEAISRDKGILAERKGAIRNENLFQAPKFIMKPKSVNTDEGNGAKFACEVVGNPAPTVTWSIDGKDLPNGGRFKSWNDGWKHFFEISHALVTDAGRYDCQVVNGHGQVNCTITLVVEKLDSPSGISDFRSLLKSRPQLGSRIKSSPSSSESEAEQLDFRGVLTRHVKTKSRPQVLEELRDIQVHEGQSVVLTCKVIGTPPPTITWHMGQKEIKESRYFQMSFTDNVASLHISGVYPEDQGEYACVAANDSGSVESTCDVVVFESQSSRDQTLELTSNPGGARYDPDHSESGYTDDVSQPESTGSRYIEDLNHDEPPFIEDLQPENIQVLSGDGFQIRAKFVGAEPLEVTWLHGKELIKSDGQHNIDTAPNSSTLTVNDCTCADTGIYTFSLNNPFGTDTVNASVTVEYIPEAPVGKPAISNITSSAMTVAWSGPSYDGGCQVTAYRVEISQDKGNQWEIFTSTCEHTSYQVTGLEANVEYICRVSAANKHGFGDPGKTSDPVVTVDRRPSGLTNGFTVYRASQTYEDDDYNLTSPLSPMAMISARYQLAFEPRYVEVDQSRNFNDIYDVGQEIGRGRFGNVYECKEKSTGCKLAAKMIRCKPSERDDVLKEVDVMNSLHHPKLLLLWDAFQGPREMILVMEHIAGGELFERISNEDYVLTERECIHFMRQICEGIRFMHENRILHLDLKPENILCITHNSNEVKIIDFGLARRFNPDVPSKVLFGTPEFVAPEVINYDQIGFETDMWSVGVVCYILMSGLSPFLGDNDAETLANVTMATWDFDDEVFDDISEDAKNFIQLLLSKDMSKRIQVNRALRHRWLSQDVKYMKAKRLSTEKHKRFLARRKWQKTGHAIRALGRMSMLQKALSVNRQNSNGSITSTSSGSSTRSRNGSQASEISLLPGAADNSHKINSVENNIKGPYQNGSVSHSASNSDVDSSSGVETVKSQDINSNELSKNNTSQDVTSQELMSQQEVASQQEEEEDGGADSRRPCFKKEIVDFEAYEGDSARFDVLIDNPEDDLKVIWLKDGEEIAQNIRKYKMEQNNKGKCSLIVKTCDLNDDAQYSVRASNSYGSVTCIAELFVESVFGTTSESTTC